MPRHVLSPKSCSFARGSGLPSNIYFLGHIQVQIPNGIWIGSAVSAQLIADSPYTLQWAPLSPKITHSYGEIWTPSNTWFPGPIWAHNPKSILIGSAVFARPTNVTDWQAEHATRSVTIGCIYIRSTAMRPKNTSAADTWKTWPTTHANFHHHLQIIYSMFVFKELASSIPIIPQATATVLDITSLRWSIASTCADGVAMRRQTTYSTIFATAITTHAPHMSSLWPPCVADADLIFLPCGFFFYLFSLSNLSHRRLDVCHTSTSTHGVALLRI